MNTIIGSNIRRARLKRRVTQKELGDLLGVSFQQIQKYESGKSRISAELLWDTANYLGFSLEYFFKERV